MLKKLLFILSMMGLFAAIGVYSIKNMPEREQIDPIRYFEEFKEDQLNLVYEDQRMAYSVPVLEADDGYYLESNFVENYISDKVFYDEEERVLTITNLEEVVRIYIDEGYTLVNGKKANEVVPIIESHEKIYISADYLETNYGVVIERGKDQRLLVVTDLRVPKEVGQVDARKSTLRTHPNKKTKIVDTVEKGEKIFIYDEDRGYYRARNENGMIGYIPVKDVAHEKETTIESDKSTTSKPLKKPIEGKVKLAWDQMTSRIDGNWRSDKYQNIQGANVISPTWFEFKDAEGNLIDRGSKVYVQQAHTRGLQVWALMSHNFSEPSYTRPILTSTAKRQKVIDQLVEAVKYYELDGINIDIENVQVDFSREWLQFMRELYPQLNALGVTVSVDIYMPSAWSRHYMRKEIAEVVDYFIVMAYDQHWATSEVAGPGAGLDWVREGIRLNLKEVPKEKLVMGIPVFTRIWEETSEGLKSRAFGMVAANNQIKQWGASPVYDEQSEQYYVVYEKEDVTYKVWIEDTDVIKKRLEVIEDNDLAGFAVWKIGLENKEVWDVLTGRQ